MLPTREELLKVPRWARVAFAARCARRAERFVIGRSPTDDFVRMVSIAEQSARDAASPNGTGPRPAGLEGSLVDGSATTCALRAAEAALASAADASAQASATAAALAIQSAEAAATDAADHVAAVYREATHAPAYVDSTEGYSELYRNAARSADAATDFAAVTAAGIGKDYELLVTLCGAEGWTNETGVEEWVFSEDAPIERRVMLAINDLCTKLCELIAGNRQALWTLDWRRMEEIVATALEGIGFDVELTPCSNDGGKDVIARCEVHGIRLTYYIEVKHWTTSRVGATVVSHFIEVNARDSTTGGLLLSSSGFAPLVYAQLAKIQKRRVRLGDDTKIVSLCQRFVQAKSQAVWAPQDVLPAMLWTNTE